jgi:UDP-N-acetylglucosamine 1-carboxyvinyltransferase
MNKMVIQGQNRLSGTVKISGAKNAALPILFSTLLNADLNILRNVPAVRDVGTLLKLFCILGVDTKQLTDNDLRIDTSVVENLEAPYQLVKTMRASVLVIGPLLSRFGRVKVSLPGGCAIGRRPIDLHLKGFESMGADVLLEHGYVELRAKRLKGAVIDLGFPTVTGTENLMMGAVLADGITTINNAAQEPEIENLAEALNTMGASVQGAGTPTIVIEGVRTLKGMDFTIIPDRIETGTYLVAAAITGSAITIENTRAENLETVLDLLHKIAGTVSHQNGSIRFEPFGEINPVEITTSPYPGFPTDLQAQFMALLCLARGTSVIKEKIFENRFMHVSELERMGAKITVNGGTARIEGTKSLSGAPVMATDLRASASLILAGLAAKGITEVFRVYHLDRGYENIEAKLKRLGADIRRESAPKAGHIELP